MNSDGNTSKRPRDDVANPLGVNDDSSDMLTRIKQMFEDSNTK